MKNRILKVLIAWLLILCMFIPSELAVRAADSAEGGEITVLEGAISQQFNDITTYRQEGALKAPSAPTEYADYIFAGWYTDEKCNVAVSQQLVGEKVTDKNKAAYAKFVPKQVLGVNAQIPSSKGFSSETSNIRFVTTVDSLQYQEVGFDLLIKGVKLNAKTTKVYKRLYAMDDSGNKIKSYIPKHINSESEYFMACVVTGVKNKDFGTGLVATPYWVTLDGTKVSAESKTKSVNMGYMSSVAEVSTKVVGEFEQPTTGWSYTNNPDYISAQGGCTDGTYYYQAVIHRDTTNIDSEVFDSDKNESIIQKYRWSDENGNWELDSTSTGVFKMANANDITYNSKLGMLVITHCGEPNAGKNRISFMDPETLTLVDPNSLNINWASGVSIDPEGKYIDCGHAITAMDYNAFRNQYVVNMSGGQKFKVLNADFSDAGIMSKPTNQTANYSKQAICSDDSYVYYLFHQKNMISVYDWDGNFVALIDLDIDEAVETENISIYKNKIYIGCDDAANQKTIIYQVTDVQGFTSDSAQGTDLFVLNDKAVTDFYAETTILTDQNTETTSSYPRVGIRLTNDAETKVNTDFVVAYGQTDGMLSYLEFFAMQNTSGTDDSTTKQKYTITSAVDSLFKAGIKLAVAKKGSTLYFYVNDVLQGTKTYDGFGAENAVTVSLYSKGTKSTFKNYKIITTDVDAAMKALDNTFVADSAKSTIRFDVLNNVGVTPQVTTNETGTWAESSIVNWNSDASSQFYAETTVKLTGNNDANEGYASAGLVLTSGENRFFVLLTGNNDANGGIIRLHCYSMTNDVFTNHNATSQPDGKKMEVSKTIALEGTHKIAVDRSGNVLKVFLDDELQTTIDLSKVTHPITGATTVGLTGWKAQATFTDYSVSLTSDKAAAAKDIFVLNEKASTDIYVETTVKVGQVESGKWPRVGLRLKNTSGENVDFILTYSNDGSTLLYAQVATTIDDSEVLQTYCVDSIKASVSTEGIKMAMAKDGDVLYFYLNNVLLGTKIFDSFAKDTAVTASLYSKYTTSYFSDYAVITKNIEIPMYEPADTFVADEKKNRIFFDILGEEDGEEAQIATNESGNWASHSIVNWNNVSTNKFYAETTVKLTGSHDNGSGAGVVLTSGDNRFYVMLVGDASGITSLQCYSTTQEVFTMYDATTCANGRVQEYSNKITSATSYKLTVYRVGNNLIICTNDQIQTVIDLSKIAYPITGASKVGLTGWRIKATFTDYSIKTGSKCPAMGDTIDAVENTHSSRNVTKTLVVDEENIAEVKPVITGSSSKHGYLYFTGKGTKQYAETYVNITGTSGDQRAGLSLLSADNNAQLGIYLHAKDTGNVDKVEIFTNGSDDAVSWTAKSVAISGIGKTGIKLGVIRDGDSVSILVNDEIINTRKLSDYTGFNMSADTETYIGLNVMQSSATFYSFRKLNPTDSYIETMTASSSRNVTKNTTISADSTVDTNVSMTGSSSKHGYLYFSEKATNLYAETYIDITGASGDQRAGLSLLSADKKAQLGVYLHAKDSGNVDKVEVFTNGSDDAVSWTAKSVSVTGLGKTRIKLGVLRTGDSISILVNDEIVNTRNLSEYKGFNMTANTETYIGLNVMQSNAKFYNYRTVEPSETVVLAGTASSKSGVTSTLNIMPDKISTDVNITGTSLKHGYLYFNEVSAKVYAETYINITSTETNNRAGLTFKNAAGDAMFGIFLRADGEYNAYRLEYINLASHTPTGNDRWPSNLVDFSSSDKTKLKLSVLRDGDNLTICVNDIYKYTYTLSGCNSSISADEETSVGLITCQGSATFSNFTCSYGDNVPTMSE